MCCTLDLLIHVSHAHRFADFCGDHVNCSNTIAEEVRPVAVLCLPELCLFTPCTVRTIGLKFVMKASNYQSWWRFRCKSTSLTSCISHIFSNFQSNFKIILLCSNDCRSAAIILTILPFDKMALAFMWLTPSFARISHYIYRTLPLVSTSKISADNVY
jgi:hypothetical protein